MDELIRNAAFEWIREQCRIFGEVLTRDLLLNGFAFQGESIPLIGATGIWKPRQFKIPVSITSTGSGKYDDDFTSDNFILYKYREDGGLNHSDNRGLQEAFRLQVPMLYFRRLIPGKYFVAFPVFIVQDDPIKQQVLVGLEEKEILDNENRMNDIVSEQDLFRRSYLTSSIKIRLHQKSFRERVLAAYKTRCCLCRINHYELLDAAHIIGDKEETGDPFVSNGLPLCKIHHAAFDSYILGISPDYRISIRQDILEEIDGPMLKHGIQELNGKSILLPGHKSDYPDRARLDLRFDKFLKAG
jgi:putative restriction endonuclease